MGDQVLAGVAEADITPPMGVEMCGYGWYQKRVCTSVLDPLRAGALWLESNGTPAVIVTADLCTIDQSQRDRVAASVERRTGAPAGAVLIGASHTHSGPSMQRMIGWGEMDAGYIARLEDTLVRLVETARQARLPASIGFARQRVEGVGVNREHPAFGVLDTAAQLMRVDRADGAPLAIVFNFGAHPVVRYPFTARVSADWPGLVAASLRQEFPGAVPLFLQGCCGNINGNDMSFAQTDVRSLEMMADGRTGQTARRLLDQILPAIRQIKTESQARVAWSYRTVSLPCAPIDPAPHQAELDRYTVEAERMTLAQLRPLHTRIGGETPEETRWREARFRVDVARRQLELAQVGCPVLSAPVQVLRIGPTAIAAWPAEVFVELGLELRQRSPVPMTFVTSYANQCVGYIPTPWAYESHGRPNEFGSYPTYFTPKMWGWPAFKPEVGQVLVEQTLAMLHA